MNGQGGNIAVNINILKKTLREISGKEKINILRVYNTTYIAHNDISLYMTIKNYRFPEIAELDLSVPLELMGIAANDSPEFDVFTEDFLLRHFSSGITELSDSYRNENKEILSKGDISVCPYNEIINRRSGSLVKNNAWIFKVFCRFPLIGVASINGKTSSRIITDIFKMLDEYIPQIDINQYMKAKKIFARQLEIRQYLKDNDAVCFIADGSILPRSGGSAEPLNTAIEFKSPQTLREEIKFSDGETLYGALIKKGITVITGGGFSGKSTMMDAIESGIYNHIPNDGREYVITDDTAIKTYTEDGRPVSNLDMSPFFTFFPSQSDVSRFSTHHASGSVSQAANIIEAAAFGSKVLLIDEDKSATNLLIRDKNMREIIHSEPIIPFTDRIDELYYSRGVSIILVVGCSSDYLKYATTVILMENYIAYDITQNVKNKPWYREKTSETKPAAWTDARYFKPTDTKSSFAYFKTVATENAKKIILDKYVSDITLLTALSSNAQLNTLAASMERLLSMTETENVNVYNAALQISDEIFFRSEAKLSIDIFNVKNSRWYEFVRPIEIAGCLSRMRNINLDS